MPQASTFTLRAEDLRKSDRLETPVSRTTFTA